MELLSLSEPAESVLKIKGSKFIGKIFPIESENQLRQNVESIKRKYLDATHHCVAYRYHDFQQIIEFQSDDGEPSGSAGLPMLNRLRSLNLVQVGSIVIRYYGGTKLGKSGLIEAYSESIYQAYLSSPKLVHVAVNKLFEIEHSYELTNTLNSLIDKTHSTLLTSEYSNRVKLLVGVPIDGLDQFRRLVTQLDSRYITTSDTGRYKMISHE